MIKTDLKPLFISIIISSFSCLVGSFVQALYVQSGHEVGSIMYYAAFWGPLICVATLLLLWYDYIWNH